MASANVERLPHLQLLLTPCASAGSLLNPFSSHSPSVVVVVDANLVAVRQAEVGVKRGVERRCTMRG